MKRFLIIGSLSAVLLLSGCWDRIEINDLAFITGTALDLTDDGQYEAALQIALTSAGEGGPGTGGSGRQEPFFVISAVGDNANEVLQKLQSKSSRRLFTAHRSVIFIGESLARRGFEDLLDTFTHDPRNRLKTYIMVVKGGKAQSILHTKYPFEQAPIQAVKEMEELKGELAVTLRDFFIASSSEGIHPVSGVIESEDASSMGKKDDRIFRSGGSALFNHFKLVGYLNEKETSAFSWVTNTLKFSRVTATLPEDKGNAGMFLNQVKRKMNIQLNEDDQVKIHLVLRGDGSIVENNTSLDLRDQANLEFIKRELEISVENQVRSMLTKVQKQYGIDCLGFGREIFRSHPNKWRTMEGQWDKTFSDVDVSIDVKLKIRGTGMAGPSLQLTEKEIRK
ncbi:Ger(x)C family spore germination protein [Cohnella sp. GCM10027633]|uniref:Ger(x)C family spore germination protein n=1 Tax=unclassified Cohnella TaxID=2636738 RepID=UPI00362FB351